MADTQYAIDISASMPAGDVTIAQLDQLTANLTGAGKNADFFQQAMRQVSASLDMAKAASQAATAALADGNAKYAELEKAAIGAAKAAERAALKGTLDPAMSRNAHEAAQAVTDYAHTLKQLEADASRAAKGEAQLATQLSNVKKLSEHADKSFARQGEKLAKLESALVAVGGPFGALGDKVIGPIRAFGGLSSAAGQVNASMIVAVAGSAALVGAVVAVTAALVAGTLAIAAWAVGLADVNRDAKLTSDALEAMHPELLALRGVIADVAAQTGVHASELQGLATDLKKAGVSADDMGQALRAAALEEAALGKGGAQEFISNIKEAKGAVGALSRDVESKLGGVVSKKILGLDAQTAKFKANIGSLFGGLNIEPVLKGLEKLVALFDENTAAGSAIKLLFESVFQPLINQAENAATVIEAFVLGFLIGLTKLYIALKPAIKAVSEFFGFKDTNLSDVLAIATKAGEYIAPVFLVFVGVLAAVAAAIGAAIVVAYAIASVPYLIGAAIIYLVGLLAGIFIDAWHSVTDFLSSINLLDVGTNIVTGLIDGIVNMGPNLLKAITGVVGSAIDAVKNILGIASPSKIFAEIGMNTGEGMASGVDDSADGVQASMQDMVNPGPAAKGVASAGASAGSSSSSLDLHGATFNFYGVEGAEDAESRFGSMLTRLLEGDVASLGGEPEPA